MVATTLGLLMVRIVDQRLRVVADLAIRSLLACQAVPPLLPFDRCQCQLRPVTWIAAVAAHEVSAVKERSSQADPSLKTFPGSYVEALSVAPQVPD